jgi:hypothetical protein
MVSEFWIDIAIIYILQPSMAVQVNGTSAPGSNDGAEANAQKLQRWVKRLGTLPSLALPTDYPRPSTSLSSSIARHVLI